MVFGFFRKSLQVNTDMWRAAGYWASVRVRYGELTDIDIDKLAKHHNASAALDAFCKNCEKKGMSPEECARSIIEHGFAVSKTGRGPMLGQILTMSAPKPEPSSSLSEPIQHIDTFVVDLQRSKLDDQTVNLTSKNTIGSGPTDGGLGTATLDYYRRVIERADEMFAEDWPFDPAWVGTLSVAGELDAITGSAAKTDALNEFIVDEFMKNTSIERCATLVMLKHMANQRELENLMRRGGRD